MPGVREFHFYGSWDDSCMFVERLLAEFPVELVWDSWLDSPEHEVRHRVLNDPLKELLHRMPAFFLIPIGAGPATTTACATPRNGMPA